MAAIKVKDFFKEPRTQSEVKSKILNEYFKAWAAILLIGQTKIPVENLLYVDLYAGQGSYDNEEPSTPVKVLTSIADNTIFNQKIKTFFNDAEPKIVAKLEQNIRLLPFYENLKHKPVILNKEANKELLNELLSKERKPPSLTFIDPLGYKGVSAKLCQLAVRNWGSDLFMLFNINRIRPGIKNTTVEHLMRELFPEKFDAILEEFDHLNKKEREDFILDQFMAHFKEKGYRALKFKVEFES
jgi:three-Cys-motif partner protein